MSTPTNDTPLKAMGGLTFNELMRTAGHPILMIVTVDLALQWLGIQHPRQRGVNSNFRSGVLSYSMKAGHWLVSQDMIVISREGELLNGQHRLYAVIETGLPIVAWVLLDADPDMFDIIDNNNPRSAAQIANSKNGTKIQAIAKAILTLDDGKGISGMVRSTNTMPRWRISSYMMDNDQQLQKLLSTAEKVRRRAGEVGAPTMYALAIHMFSVVHPDFNYEDAVEWTDDNNLSVTNMAFRRYVSNAFKKANDKGSATMRILVCGTFLQFLDACHLGRELRKFGNYEEYNEKYLGLYRKARGIQK